MSPIVFGLVTSAAVLHAAWNAVLRGGRDRLWSMTLMMVAIFAVSSAILLYAHLPNAISLPYAFASALIHVAYNLALVRTYRSGDLGQSYPVSRGSSPVLVALGALVFDHERLSPISTAGIALVSAGILWLALQGRRLSADYLLPALTTGVLIAGYTIVDGSGVRLSGDVLGYTASMFLLWSVLWAPVALALQRARPRYGPRETGLALAGGVVSIAAYGIVVWAMGLGFMAPVSALRETSVIWAAVIGRLCLRERLSRGRLAACLVIAAGAALLS